MANFIAGATKNKGGLHRSLGIPEGQTIPRARIVAAAKQSGRVGQQARLALTLGKLRPTKKSGGASLARAAAGKR
jgi:hypothetical protein